MRVGVCYCVARDTFGHFTRDSKQVCIPNRSDTPLQRCGGRDLDARAPLVQIGGQCAQGTPWLMPAMSIGMHTSSDIHA